jgi:hypothetical protein
MAKVSTIAKNDRRLALSKKYSAKREELRKALKDPNVDDETKL